MKAHISITIDPAVLHLVKRIALEERRSLSQVIEMALLSAAQRRFSSNPDTSEEALPVTDAAFSGFVDRSETYGNRI
jgi:hypothetical protein